MRVLIAFDKFKGCLTAPAACAIAAKAVRELHPDWEIDVAPLADGGEGFAHILTEAVDGRWEAANATGPRGGALRVPCGFVSAESIAPRARALLALPELHDDDEVGLLDLASASGLTLLAPERRNPWHTTTLGTGELLRFAAGRGVKALVLGLGGSATNDLGLGALVALGFRALDAAGNDVNPPSPARWSEIVRIVPPMGSPLPQLRLACDVTNPLLGPNGATAVFGPQKGLPPETCDELEAAMARIAQLLCDARGVDFAEATNRPGAGAAGGAAFGLSVGCGAQIVSGAALVEAWFDLPRRVAQADLVLTGEGRFDATSLQGKGPGALLALARAAQRPVHVFAGGVEAAATSELAATIRVHAISPPEIPLGVAMKEAGPRLAAAVRAALAQ